MSTPEKGPRVIAIQDHLDMAKHFTFSVSTDEQEIAERQALAGRGININSDQTAGIDVAATTLERLEDEDKAVWARIVGGASLNSAMYLLREVGPRRMYRNFPMANLFSITGEPLPLEKRQYTTQLMLRDAQIASERYSQSKKANQSTQRNTNGLARELSSVSMRLGVYDFELPEGISEHDAMELAKQKEIEMQAQAIAIGLETRHNPSLAQLRSEASPLGAHIVGSPRKYSPRIIKQFKEASREAGAPRGY